jgi:hypothetical protein
MEEEKILNVTQLQVVDKIQNDDVILLIRDTGNGKQCFQIKGSDFRGESAYEAALKQGFVGTYQDWVQHIKEITEYDTKSLLSFNGIANNDANSALRSGIYPSVTKNVPINGETFTIQTLRTTTAVYNQYVSTQIALGVTGAAIGKIYIRKNTQKSGKTTYEDWIKISHEASTTKKKNTKTQYVIGRAMPIGKLDGGARLNAYIVKNGFFRFRLHNVPQLKNVLSSQSSDEIVKLLDGVTWHIFVDDIEVYTGVGRFIFHGLIEMYIRQYKGMFNYFILDESRSSVDLSSDMYIYLTDLGPDGGQNYTSKTLFYYDGNRIWKPDYESPYMDGRALYNKHSGFIQLQKLRTSQRSSKTLGQSRKKLRVRKYRGQCVNDNIPTYGTYRYRLVKNGKKTQWRTISIMENATMGSFSIK